MRVPTAALSAAAILVTVASAQTKSDGPTDQKAQKTYQQALEELHDRNPQFALEDFDLGFGRGFPEFAIEVFASA